MKAPDFTLNAVFPTGNWQPVTLSSYAAAGRATVLVFYPLDFSPTCSNHVPAFSRLAADFDDLGADVLCVSRDSVYTHRAWSRELGLQVPLLSDMTLSAAQLYGADCPERGQTYRATFVIGADGKIRFAHREEDSTELTLSAEQLLTALPGLLSGLQARRAPSHHRPWFFFTLCCSDVTHPA
ncbi:redoxin domain-containing protein [Deinococcus radiophilus]|uniref:redoxin domain-containing protein n=1 Tax=Deinococcus radiophilus TaxID=32062 RepID=UPI0036D375FE